MSIPRQTRVALYLDTGLSVSTMPSQTAMTPKPLSVNCPSQSLTGKVQSTDISVPRSDVSTKMPAKHGVSAESYPLAANVLSAKNGSIPKRPPARVVPNQNDLERCAAIIRAEHNQQAARLTVPGDKSEGHKYESRLQLYESARDVLAQKKPRAA